MLSFSSGVPPGRGGVRAVEAGVFGSEGKFADGASLHRRSEGRTAEGEFVEAGEVGSCAVDDEGVQHVAAFREGLGHLRDGLCGVDAEELAARAGGVGHGTEQVEDGAEREAAADGVGVAHGGVHGRREEEGEVVGADGLGSLLRGVVDGDAEAFEDVRRAAF